METILTIAMFTLSCCIGIILMGTILVIYISYFTKKRIYCVIALIGILSIITVVAELSVLSFSMKGMRGIGQEFHRIEAVTISYYLFALPYLFHNILELNYYLRRINRYIYIAGLAAALIITATAFLYPGLFLYISDTTPEGVQIWNIGRAEPGIVFRLRDILLMFVSFYSLTLLFYELKTSADRRFLNSMIVAITMGILSGVADLVMNLIEVDSLMYTKRIISFISFGLTAFTIIAIIAVIRVFIDQNRALERLKKNEFMEILAGGIAHDFNNLLTGILGNTSLAIFNSSGNGGNIELLKSIEKAAKRGRGLSRQLLDFSRGGAIIRGAVSLEKLITENVRFIMTGSGIETIFHFEKGLSGVNADESQISQVIQNIAINAKQAMGEAGRLTVTCRNLNITGFFSILKPGKYVKIDFRDTGHGIKEKDLKNIFDPYFTTKNSGTGLGLATTLSIIKNHGGDIEARSVAGDGTTFSIYLPASEQKYIEEEKEAVKPSKYSGNALMMDDDNLILGIGMKLLTELGFSTTCVSCGEDAVEEYKKAMDNGAPFRLVIMDLTITGGMGGKEAVRYVRAIDPDATVVLSSGYSNEMAGHDYREMGFDGILPKPYTFDEMRRCIDAVLTSSVRKS